MLKAITSSSLPEAQLPTRKLEPFVQVGELVHLFDDQVDNGEARSQQVRYPDQSQIIFLISN